MDESTVQPTPPSPPREEVNAEAGAASASDTKTPWATPLGTSSASAEKEGAGEESRARGESEAISAGQAAVAPVPAKQVANPPVRFGKFHLLEELSRSPNSVVYRAEQDDLHGREVAVKVLVEGPQAEKGETEGDRVTRFRREVENIARLRHPNIVSVYEVGEIDGFTYFSMEYVDGCSLGQWIEEHGPMSGREACELMFKVARAIHYAHTRGIIHRDIKPANILLDRVNGEPMIADFGLAKDIRSDIRITQSGVTVGTPPYMPPEQARGQHDLLDSRSDVYALGATLYELVTGKPPFDGDTGIQVMMRVLEKAPARPRRLAPSLSPDLEAIVLRCLEKRQRERYDNAELLAQDLARFLRGEWVHARKTTLVHRVGRFLKAYRDLAYFLLAVTIVYALHLAGQYVAGTSLQSERSVPILPDGAQAEGWTLEAVRGNVEPFYPMELWLNDPSRGEPGSPTEEAGEAVAISEESLKLRDFEVRFQADILGGVSSPRREPALGVLLVPERAAVEVPAGSWPPIREGYVFMLGAHENTRAAVYRVERNPRDPEGPGRATALLEEPRLRLGEQGDKYDISVSVVGSRLSFDVRDVTKRQRWRLEVSDDFPLPLPPTSRVGFLSAGTSVVIERWSLAAHSWHDGSPRLDRADGFFQIGAYEEALRYYEAAMYFARDDAVLRNQLAERMALTREALAEDQPLKAAPGYEPLHERRLSVRASRRLIECYLAAGLGRHAQAVLEEMLAEDEERLEGVSEADQRWLIPAGRRWAAELSRQAQASWPWDAEGALPRRGLPSAFREPALRADENQTEGQPAQPERDVAQLARHHATASPSPQETAEAAQTIYREIRRLLRTRTRAGEAGGTPVDMVSYVELLAGENALAAWMAQTTGDDQAQQAMQSELTGAELHRWLHATAHREPPRIVLALLEQLRSAYVDAERASAYLALLTRRPEHGVTTRTNLLEYLDTTRIGRERLQRFSEELAELVEQHDLHDDPSVARLEQWTESLHEPQTE